MYEGRKVLRGENVVKRELARRMRREMTAAEYRLWQHLRANRWDGIHFRRQVVIEGFIVDLYCPGKSLVIVVDGDIHDLQPDYDAERTKILQNIGLRIIRFHNDDVMRDALAVRDAIGREN